MTAALLLQENGRFETNKKICLSISNYHPEHWQPSWDIRTIITALVAFFPTEGGGETLLPTSFPINACDDTELSPFQAPSVLSIAHLKSGRRWLQNHAALCAQSAATIMQIL